MLEKDERYAVAQALAGLGLALSGLAVVLAAAWWASQTSREPALWSELRVPPAFAIPRDFNLGEYRLSWGGKSLAPSVAGSARPPLWESEGGFRGRAGKRRSSAVALPGAEPG